VATSVEEEKVLIAGDDSCIQGEILGKRNGSDLDQLECSIHSEGIANEMRRDKPPTPDAKTIISSEPPSSPRQNVI
jgi:hypothetical protein